MTRGRALFLLDDQPVRALLFVHVETLAVIASNALAGHDFRSTDRPPLTRLFTALHVLRPGPEWRRQRKA